MYLRENIKFEKGIPLDIRVQSINRYPFHWHKDIVEIILPINGSVEVTANFEKMLLNLGEFCFINNETIHSIRSPSKTIVVIFHIDLNYFEDEFQYIKQMFFRSKMYFECPTKKNKNIFLNVKENHIIKFRNLLISILANILDKNNLCENLLESFSYQLIYLMVYEFNWIRFVKQNNKFISTTALNRYHRVVKYIQENYAEKITLDDIVSQEFVTKTYFSHFWKDISSYSFQERINYERVLKSEFLLFTDATISEIAKKCGFSDVKYFYKNFKRWYGCMPLEHRSKCVEYIKKGSNYIDLEINDLEKELDDYIENFFTLEFNFHGDSDISSLIETYIKLKYLQISNKRVYLNAPKYVILNPLSKSNCHLEKNDIIFNWNHIDLFVNICYDLGYILQIKLNSDDMEEESFYKIVDKFILLSIHRYDIETLRKWHFFINCKNMLRFNTINHIEKLLYSNIGDAKISYFFEF